MYKNRTGHIARMKSTRWHAHPQSTNGSDGYPTSGGGLSDGGRFPNDIPKFWLAT